MGIISTLGSWLHNMTAQWGGNLATQSVNEAIKQTRDSVIQSHFPKLRGSLADEASFAGLIGLMEPGDRKALVEVWLPSLGPNSNRVRQMILVIYEVTKVPITPGLTADRISQLQAEANARAIGILTYLSRLPDDNFGNPDDGTDRKTQAAVALRLMKARESDYLGAKILNFAKEGSEVRRWLDRNLTVSASERERVVTSIEDLRRDNSDRWARLTATPPSSGPITYLVTRIIAHPWITTIAIVGIFVLSFMVYGIRLYLA